MDGRWARLINTTGVVFTRSEALAAGVCDKEIAGAIRRGEWVRVRRGAYAHSGLWAELDPPEQHLSRARAVVRNARSNVALSHTTAALAHGADLWQPDLADIHLTRLDRKAGRAEAGVRQHRAFVADEDLVEVDGLLVTAATRTVLDLTTILDVEHSLVVADSMCHLGLTTPEDLAQGARSIRFRPHSLTTQLVSSLVNPGRTSVGESRTGHLLWSQGLPTPVCQYPVTDPRGRVFALLDFAWPELGVFLEFDGKAKYSLRRKDGETEADAVFREKKREDRVRAATGWTCVRITWADLEDPVGTGRRIREILLRQAALRGTTTA